MRNLMVFLATAALFGSSGATAKINGPITACPQSGGVSAPPFFGVRAVPPTGRRAVAVSGGYALNKRGESVRLVEVKPQGINPKTLLLHLEVVSDPAAFGDCRPFKNIFATFPQEVRITDSHAKSITVPVHRPQ